MFNPATPKQINIIAEKCWVKRKSQEEFEAWAATGLDKMLATKLLKELLEHVRYNSDPEKGMQTISWARNELSLVGYNPNIPIKYD